VEVTSFVGPNGDAHVYEPTPGDAKTLADDPILVVNGLGHTWQNLASGKICVHNIRDGLIAADPAGKDATRRTPASSWSISRTSRRP
jgi:zinc/manganese transport system substrate-binding protein